MRSDALRALKSAFRRCRAAERELEEMDAEMWAPVKEHCRLASVELDLAIRHIEEHIPMRRGRVTMKRGELTPAMKGVLAAVQHGAVSHPEIARATGLTSYQVSNAVRALRERGLISKNDKGRHNGIRVPQGGALQDAWRSVG